MDISQLMQLFQGGGQPQPGTQMPQQMQPPASVFDNIRSLISGGQGGAPAAPPAQAAPPDANMLNADPAAMMSGLNNSYKHADGGIMGKILKMFAGG